ncbi:MAG: DegV family protein [Clostridia bacterium]|jgi:DegV family protein with EDD domain|nr:DegV family protein [Clostridia bacterium]MBT7123203.1 DegV family protein [Clostridia bacterium]
MRDFVIATDSDTEIPYQFAEKTGMPVFLMPYTVDGEEKLFDLGKTTDYEGFYKKIGEGAKASTSTRSPADIADFFREIVKDKKDVLQLSFSSQLSAHYSMCEMARESVLEEYPKARIELVDTMRISMGAGVLVMKAQEMKDAGAGLDEIKDWVEANKLLAHAWFSVDDLNFLKRGGRVSGAAAMVGTILGVKPILKLNNEGKIVAADKVKGRKNVHRFLLDTIEKNIENSQEQTIYLMHAADMENAKKLKAMIEDAVDCKGVEIMDIGPVIGCHTGPGALSVVFMGKAMES